MIDPAFEILNQRGTPMFFSDTFANRPNAGIVGRIFISTDTYAFYRDNGSGWDLIGGPGTGTITGSGTPGYFPLFSGSSTTIANSALQQGGGLIYTTNDFRADAIYLTDMSTGNGALWTSGNDLSLANYNPTGKVNIQAGGGGYAIEIASNLNSTFFGNIIRNGGLSTQFLKADGSLDSSAYVTTNIYNSNGTITGNRVVSLNSNYLSFAGGQTYIGSQTASSGLLTINNASSDAHIQVVGANAPSVRIDNLGSGATQRFVMGLATATNNFIQGSTAGDICISTASASPLLFGMWQSINASEVMRITTSNNVSIGYNVDLGYKLYVNGAIGTNGSITIGNGGSGTSYLYALSGSDLILNAGGDRITIRQTGNVIINNLSGSGTRMVVADANGVLSTQAIGTGSITGSGTTNYIPNFTGSSSIGNSNFYINSNNLVTASTPYIYSNAASGGTTIDAGIKLDGTNKYVSFWNVDSEKMRLTSTGLGIGTTSPNTKLEIIGTSSDQIRLGTAATEHYKIGRNASTGYLDFYGSQTGYVGYVWGGIDGQKMTLNSLGRLGVGSSTPKTILQSTGAAQTSSPTLGSATGGALYLTSTDTDYGTLFGASASGLGWIQQQRTDGTATSYALSLQPSGGNLLIGTTTDAGYKLDVNGTGRFTGIVTFGSTGGSGLRVYGGSGTNQWDMYLNGANLRFSDNTGGGYFAIDSTLLIGSPTFNGSALQVNGQIDAWQSVNTLLRIRHNGLRGIIETFTGGGYSTTTINENGGNVSIGGTTASDKLDIYGPDLGGLTIRANSGPTITLIDTGNSTTKIYVAQDDLTISTYNISRALTIMGSNGNTLIGTTADAGQKLQVNGTGYFAGDVTLQASSTTLVLNRTGGTTFGTGIGFQTSGTNNWIIGTAQASVGTDFSIYNYGIGGGALNITYGNNNIQIGSTTDDGEKLKVVGTSRFTTFMGVGTGPDASTMIYVKGADTSSTNFAAVFQNSAGTNLVRFFNNGKVNMSALPTSSAGLSAGDIWNDAGTLKIV